MPISFNDIPSNLRRPGAFIEFDSSMAVRGPQTQVFKTMIIGQKISAGSATVETPVQVRSKEDADLLFGTGSQLAQMCAAYFKKNTQTETWAIPLADASAGVQATGKFAFTGTATENGTICAYIGGVRVTAAVLSGDLASAVATALRAAIDANHDLPVDDGGSNGEVTVTMKNKGVEGNSLDLRLNYYKGEEIPAGLACTITPMASGATNPDVQDALDVLGDDQWNVIIHPYTDTANLTALSTELENRWGPLPQNDGHAFSAVNKSYGDLATFGNALNSKQLTFVGCTKYPTAPWVIAAQLGAVVAYYSPIDQARPLQTLSLDDVLPPAKEEQLTNDDRNLLLFDGISTLNVDAGGVVRIERLITTYKKNAAGATDTAFLDVEPKLTLSYIRYDFRNYLLRKYPRYKVADDGTRFGPGQVMLTPKMMKAETISKFREWEYIGLVEDAGQFKEDLIVERNVSDPCRLDIRMSPNLVNQLRIFGVQIAFLL